MRRQTFAVGWPEGLHARPAAELVKVARDSRLRSTVESQGRRADARSILAVLALGVRAGAEVMIEVDGGTPEEEEALAREIGAVLASGGTHRDG